MWVVHCIAVLKWCLFQLYYYFVITTTSWALDQDYRYWYVIKDPICFQNSYGQWIFIFGIAPKPEIVEKQSFSFLHCSLSTGIIVILVWQRIDNCPIKFYHSITGEWFWNLKIFNKMEKTCPVQFSFRAKTFMLFLLSSLCVREKNVSRKTGQTATP